MTPENSTIRTQMRFIPNENVHGLLIDLLDPFLVERLMQARQPLAFYSINAYMSESPATNMTLRRFMNTADDRLLPYDSMSLSSWSTPSGDNKPVRGLAIDVAVNTTGIEDITWEAEALGFSDENKRIMARLTLPHYHLHSGKINGKKALELQEYVNGGAESAVTEFIQTDLT